MSCNTPPFLGVGRGGKAFIEAYLQIADRSVETINYNMGLFFSKPQNEASLGEMAFSGTNARKIQLACKRMIDDYFFLQSTINNMAMSIGDCVCENTR